MGSGCILRWSKYFLGISIQNPFFPDVFQVNALSPGGHGLVLVFACGPSPAVKGVQDLFLDDMRVRMVAEAFG